jgi:hypothetical protein
MNTRPVDNGYERISIGMIVILPVRLLIAVSQGTKNIVKGKGHCGVCKTRIINIFTRIIGIINPCVILRVDNIEAMASMP